MNPQMISRSAPVWPSSPAVDTSDGWNQSPSRRTKQNRGLSVAHFLISADLEEGSEPNKDKLLARWKNQGLASGLSYCVCSCSMILLNKVVLSGYDFNAGISLMCYQNLVAVVIVYALTALGIITTEPITFRLASLWFPVNMLFVGMLVSSIFSLKYMNVAMVTILKNVTNIITAIGEVYLFNKHHNIKVWGSLLLMIVSAFCGGFTDLSYNSTGYAWQIINCFLTATYSLTLRKVMDLAKKETKSGNLGEFSMVLLNNVLSLPLGIGLVFIFREDHYLQNQSIIKSPMFWIVSTLSGLFGLAISFTSMWFLHQTGPTTHSLVGSLNKIPLSVAGILLFKVPTSVSNLLSILFGLFAGIMFAKAKMR